MQNETVRVARVKQLTFRYEIIAVELAGQPCSFYKNCNENPAFKKVGTAFA